MSENEIFAYVVTHTYLYTIGLYLIIIFTWAIIRAVKLNRKIKEGE